ncbi:GTP-binding protein [Rothia sp. P13129]|uniref:GTP-binding protein n=1 Tax=Rothia sp. P13129 TaxID=3402664 RepID=UPI003ACBF99B
MSITAISSLSHWARDNALNTALKALKNSTDTTPTILSFDILDPEENAHPEKITIRVTRNHHETTKTTDIILKSNCSSCATTLLLSDCLQLSDNTEETLILLPPGVSLNTVINVAEKLERHIHSAILALDISTIEDELWDNKPLEQRGLNGGCEDERTPGEFIITEIAWADTAITSEIPFTHSTDTEKHRAQELLAHLGTHLKIISCTETTQPICGCHQREDSIQRAQAGHLGINTQELTPITNETPQHTPINTAIRTGKNFTTVVLTTSGILHHDRFASALPHLAEGNCRLRGTLCINSYGSERIAIEGIGPFVWLEQQGQWEQQEPHNTIAITGDDLNPTELQELLNQCIITGEEIAENLLNSTS